MSSLMIKPNFKLSDQLSCSQPWSSRTRMALMLLAGPGCGVRPGMCIGLSKGTARRLRGNLFPNASSFLKLRLRREVTLDITLTEPPALECCSGKQVKGLQELAGGPQVT